MRESSAQYLPLRCVLDTSFAGAWGEDPVSERDVNAFVLRSTNLGYLGEIDYSTAAGRVFTEVQVDRKLLSPGDILLEVSGGSPAKPVGRVALFDPVDSRPYAVSNFFRVLRVSSDFDPRFVYRSLVQLYNSPQIFSFQQQTTGLINLKVSDYLETSIRVPVASEQRKVAEILDEVDLQINRASRSLCKSRLIAKSALFRRLSHLERESFEKGLVGGGQEVLTLTGGLPQSEAGVAGPEGVPIYGSSGLAGYGVHALSQGETIVIGRVGEGGVGSVRYVANSAWVTDNALWAKRIHPDWLAEYLALYLDWRDLRQLRSQTGQPLITQGAIGALSIGKPLLEDQRNVIHMSREAAKMVKKSQEEVEKLRTLKRGLMLDLLTGKVRVSLAE
jgi:type I restriction enzyme S subunit